MAGVAINGSRLKEIIVPNIVKYDIEEYKVIRYEDRGTDINGVPYPPKPIKDWVNVGTNSTGAKITGTVSVPSSKMRLSGVHVAKIGDITTETWTAYPPVPASNENYRYIPTSKTSDIGQGKIISGSSKANLQGQSIAIIGSQVLTCLDTITTIQTGNTKMNLPE